MSSEVSFDVGELLCLAFAWAKRTFNNWKVSKLLLVTFSFENDNLTYYFASFLLPTESSILDCNKFQSLSVQLALHKFLKTVTVKTFFVHNFRR